MKHLKDLSEREFVKYLTESAANLSNDRGEPVDRTRKKISFDFLLRRLAANAPGVYVLKGGYAIELKFNVVRATKDIDLLTRSLTQASITNNYEPVAERLRQRIVDHLADPEGDDDRFIRFRVGEEMKIVRGGGGGIQLSVRMMVGNQRFSEFSVDLSAEDIRNPAKESLEWNPIVPGFSKSIESEVLSNEQIFAEKLHAYMRHGEDFQDRTKDLVDLVFLAHKKLDHEKCRTLIKDVFSYWQTEGKERNLVSLPSAPKSVDELKQPPAAWAEVYQRMASDMGIEGDMEAGFRSVLQILNEILTR